MLCCAPWHAVVVPCVVQCVPRGCKVPELQTAWAVAHLLSPLLCPAPSIGGPWKLEGALPPCDAQGGKAAAQTILDMKRTGDFSSKSTAVYERRWMELFGYDFAFVRLSFSPTQGATSFSVYRSIIVAVQPHTPGRRSQALPCVRCC